MKVSWPPLLLAVALSGCALVPATVAKPAPPPMPLPSTADRLLLALAHLRVLDEAGLAAEITKAKENAERQPTDLARVEAALAMAASPASDDQEIVSLVSPVLRESPPPVDPSLRAMAGFLQGLATDRRKLRDGLQSASAKAREDRRDAQAQRQRADAQQERADRLQQKLEALTNLEKSLANRKNADDSNRRPR